VTGTGIDISTTFIAAARARAAELGVDGRVSFVQGDASGYVARAPAGITSCIGATWIGGGIPGMIEPLRRSLQPGGMMLIGEPYWHQQPPTRPPSRAANAASKNDFLALPELIERSATWAATWSKWSSPARTSRTGMPQRCLPFGVTATAASALTAEKVPTTLDFAMLYSVAADATPADVAPANAREPVSTTVQPTVHSAARARRRRPCDSGVVMTVSLPRRSPGPHHAAT
jgi:hypothetical protein